MTTQSYCAKLMGISERRFRELRDEGVLPRTEKYDPEVLLPIYCAHLRELTVRRDRDSAPQSTDEARLQKARADKAEMEADEMRGRLVPVEQIAEPLHNAVQIMKTRIMAVPAKAATQVGAKNPAVAERVIRQFVVEALEDLSRVRVVRTAKD